MNFEKIVPGIDRLIVPFEDSFTSVFLISDGGKHILIDSAATPDDVETIILPALARMNVIPDEIVLSHAHSDHAGGLRTVLDAFPGTPVRLKDEQTKRGLEGFQVLSIEDGDWLTEHVMLLCLRGHCDDAAAMFDTRTNTLLSCDCVQLRGGGRYGINLSDVSAYFDSLKRIISMPTENLIASHDYMPFGAEAWGREAVLQYVAEAEDYARQIERFVKSRGSNTHSEIAAEWNLLHPTEAPISSWTVNNFSV